MPNGTYGGVRGGFISTYSIYNGVNGKPPSEREGDRVSGGRSLRDFRFVLTSL